MANTRRTPRQQQQQQQQQQEQQHEEPSSLQATADSPPPEQEQMTEQENVQSDTISNTNETDATPLSADDVLTLTQYSLQSIISPGTTTPLPDRLKQLASRVLFNVNNKQMIASTPLSVSSVEDTSLVSTVNLADSASAKSQEAKNSFQYRNTNAFPSFSGFNDPADPKRSLLETSRLARDWVEHTNHLLEIKRVPDHMKLLEGTVNLKGQAKDWLSYLKRDRGPSYDWTQFKVDLLEEYCDVDEELSRGESYTALKLYQGQLSVDEYAQKFRELATRWFPEETEKTRFMRFVLGLKPELAAEVRKMDPTKLSKAIARAKTVESTLKETSYSYQNRGFKGRFNNKGKGKNFPWNKNNKSSSPATGANRVNNNNSNNSKSVGTYNNSSNYPSADSAQPAIQHFSSPIPTTSTSTSTTSSIPVDTWSPYPIPPSQTQNIQNQQLVATVPNQEPLQQYFDFLKFQQFVQLQQQFLMKNQPHLPQSCTKPITATEELERFFKQSSSNQLSPIQSSSTQTTDLPNSSFVGSILTFYSLPQQVPPKLLDTLVEGSNNYELLIDSGSTTDVVSLSIVRELQREKSIVTFPVPKQAALIKDYVSIIGYIPLDIEIKLKHHTIHENRSFYVVDTNHHLFILGLPFIHKYKDIISLQDLVSADIQPLQSLSTDSIKVSTFDFDDNYIDTLLKNNDNSVFLAEIFTLNHIETEQNKTIDVEINTPLVKQLRSKILVEFADVVTNDSPSELPPYRKHVHRIILKEPRHVTARTQYPLSYAEKQELTKQVDQLLSQGFVRQSASPFNSPVLFVRKKDNTMRMCIDFRLLNNNTVKDKFPIPHIDQLISKFGTAKVFSKLDLMSGYYQVRIHDEDIEKTAFSTDSGHYEWVVMPFGLTNAPATFQRMMNTVLQPFLTKFVQVYLDDIFIYSNDYEQHFKHVSQVLETLRKHQLIAKEKKCAFFYQNLRFLGHLITPEGIKTDPEKVDKVRDWPTPKTPKDGMKFLGLTSYYRKFIKDHSRIAKPIHDFMNKKCAWPKEQDDAFAKLKNALISAPTLVHPIWKDEFKFVLHTDACGNALGYTLEQLDPNGKLRGVIAYGSKKLVGSQLHYGIYDREFLAVVEALKTWRYYLLGRHFLIFTDHKSLVHLGFQNLIDSTRVARWLDYLAQYDFEIRYISGSSNSAADALSRYPYDSNAIYGLQLFELRLQLDSLQENENLSQMNHLFAVGTVTSMEINDELKQKIIKGYKKDSVFGEIYNILKTGASVPPHLNHHIQHYKFENDLLYYRTLLTEDSFTRVAIPDVDRLPQLLIKNAHSTLTAGHFGIWKTYKNLVDTFYWKSMLPSIKRFCNTCIDCQKHNTSTQKLQGLFSPLPVPEGRWTDVSMDFITGIPTTNRGFDMIMVITDRFTKMAHFIPTDKTLTADRCALLFVEFCWKHHGFPRRLVSDKDIRFMSRFWHTVHFLVGTSLLFSTTNHPQTDGQTERVNKIINQLVRKHASNDMFNWDRYLPVMEFAYNSTYQDSIKMAPFKLAYGYVPDSPKAVSSWNIADERYSPHAEEYIRRALLTLRQAQDNIVEAQRVQEHHYNLKRREHHYRCGDWVLVHREAYGHNSTYVKIQPVYYGPFKLVKDLGNNTFEVDLPKMNKKDRELNVQSFKPYQQPVDFLQRLPVTDLEIRSRITEIVGIGGYDLAADTIDVFWRDCDPRHATTISGDQFLLVPESLRQSLLHNAQIELRS